MSNSTRTKALALVGDPIERLKRTEHVCKACRGRGHNEELTEWCKPCGGWGTSGLLIENGKASYIKRWTEPNWLSTIGKTPREILGPHGRRAIV